MSCGCCADTMSLQPGEPPVTSGAVILNSGGAKGMEICTEEGADLRREVWGGFKEHVWAHCIKGRPRVMLWERD